MEAARQAHAVYRNGRFDGYQMDARQVERGVDPDPDVAPETQATPFGQQGDLPGRNGRDADAVRASRLFAGGAGGASKTRVVVDRPDQYMRIEDDHRVAAQLDGSVAGEKGLS